jgi:hypothetical protein
LRSPAAEVRRRAISNETDGRGGEVLEVVCDRDRSQCRARIQDDGGDRFMGVLVGLDDSDDYSLVTTWEE